jgi:hypothetical protein
MAGGASSTTAIGSTSAPAAPPSSPWAVVFLAGGVLLQLGYGRAAQELYEAAAAAFGTLGDRAHALAARGGLANALQQQGALEAALHEYRAVVAEKTALHGPTAITTLTTRENMAVALCEWCDAAQASAADDDDGNVNGGNGDGGNGDGDGTVAAANRQAELALAQSELEAVVLGFTAAHGCNHRSTLHAQVNVADALRRRRQHAACATLLERVAIAFGELMGPGHWEVLHARASRGQALLAAAKAGLAAAAAAATAPSPVAVENVDNVVLAQALEVLEAAVPPLVAQLGSGHADAHWAELALAEARALRWRAAEWRGHNNAE